MSYLPPTGGAERAGVIDDGCVFGHPGGREPAGLLDAGAAAVRAAHDEALEHPVEIIVEFETRLCAPVRPSGPVAAAVAGGPPLEIAPGLVRGTDDGVPMPAGAGALTAEPGAAAAAGESGRLLGYTAACLWRTGDGVPAALSIGPALVTPEEFAAGIPVRVGAEVDGAPVAAAEVALPEVPPAQGGPALAVSLAPATRPLEEGEELNVDADVLGVFEIRVGAQA
ncbi:MULTISPECIES: hypothetical protein [Nocardiopsis]|uniref:hypothetical protein n=1 Tax=Nocardiopsis TaxID=2013 RepID=UPI00034CBAB7